MRTDQLRWAGGLGGRAAWSVLDQAASSLGSLVLSIAVARSSDLPAFGAFATAFTTYTLVLTGSRALLSMPYLMRAQTDDGGRVSLASGTVGAALLVGAAAAAAIGVAAVLCGGPLRAYLAVLAAGIPLLLLQDAYRHVLLHRHGTRVVATNDLTWTVVQVALTAGAALAAPPDPGVLFVVAWAVGAAIAVGSAVRRTRIRPDPVAGARFLRRTRRLGMPLVVEAFAVSGSSSAALFAVATVAGLTAIGPLRGAQVLLGPVAVLVQGLLFLVNPLVLRMGTADRARLLGSCAGFGGIVVALSMIATAVVLAIPDALGTQILGPSWEESRQTVLPTGLLLAAGGVQLAAVLGFRAHRIVRRTMAVQLVAFPLPVAGAVLGVRVGGPVGATYGMVGATAGIALVLWWLLLAQRPAADVTPAGTG